MKDRLFDAVGMIDGRYIDEAHDGALAEAAQKRRLRGRVLLAAAVLAAALCIVGFAAAGRLYFAPGVGIVDEESAAFPQVWACYDEGIKLGDAIIDAVVLSEDEEGYTMNIWLYGAKLYPEPRIVTDEMGNETPISDVTVCIDGEEYSAQGSKTSKGVSAYVFKCLPKHFSPTLRDREGNETTVSLISIGESQYSYIRGISFGKDKAITAIPLSGSENVFTAQLTDPLTFTIAQETQKTYASCTWLITHDDGQTSQLELSEMVIDGKLQAGFSGSALPQDSRDRGIRSLTAQMVVVSHNFASYNPLLIDDPRQFCTFNLPEPGEGIDCDFILYGHHGIVCRVTRIDYTEQGLVYTTKLENDSTSPFSEEMYEFQISAGILTIEDGTTQQYGLTFDPSIGTLISQTRDGVSPIAPGTEIGIYLRGLTYAYLPEAPAADLGTISFK
ncbi:MAG: hypothetical protein IJX53_05190 [Clostridia bacterium]|nr:hypothetical protein [Clostridia bacterium]